MLKNVWNLQLFADEGGVEGATDTNSIPDDTGANVSGAAAQSLGEDGVAATPEDGTVNPETDEVSFEDLIEGKYKDDFNKATSAIVQKRVKGMQSKLDEANANSETLQPMINFLAEKYNLDVNDPQLNEHLKDAVLKDKTFYEDAAVEAGMDTDTYMQVQELKRENQEYAQREQQNEQERAFQEQFERHMLEAEEVKKIYPNFDLIEEIKNNPTFAMQLDCGVPVRNAFEAAHWEELDALKAEAIASEASKQVANTVKANKKRPAENGLDVKPGNQIDTDIRSLTKEQLDDIEARARRGEKISFQ